MANSATSTASEDNKQDVEACNHGLVNLNSSSMATMNLGKISLVVLLSVIGLGLLGYRYKKRDAVALTVAYCSQRESITHPQRKILPLETTGSATTVQAFPSSPNQGLWEKCR